MKKIAFIPARSGSTRIKNKNLKKINDKPLIYWSVYHAIKSSRFDEIIFSSDSENYYKVLIRYLKKNNINSKNLIFDKRSTKHTKKKSKIFDYIKSDFIRKFNLKDEDLLVLLLPTCPLRSLKTLQKIIDYATLIKKNCFTANEYNFHLSFGFSLKKKSWKPLFKYSPMLTGNTQSQNQKKFYYPNPFANCMFVRNIKKSHKSIYQGSLPFITSPIESIDIDTFEDLKIAQKLAL